MNRTIKTLAGAAVLVSAVSLVPAFSVSALTLSTDAEATGASVVIEGTPYKIDGISLNSGEITAVVEPTLGGNKLTLTLSGNATLNDDLTADGYLYVSLKVANGSTLTINKSGNYSDIINNEGTIIVNADITLGSAAPFSYNIGTVIVTKNGDLTISGNSAITGSTTINAEVSADGTLTSGKVTKGSSSVIIAAGDVTGDVINFFIGDLNVADNDGVSSLDGARINHVLSVSSSSASPISVNNASTTFGDIKADLISAIETADSTKVGLIYLDGDSDKNAILDTTPIDDNMTFAYDAYSATVKVTDTTAAISNVRDLTVSDPAKTLQDVLDDNSISLGEGYGLFEDEEGTVAADLTKTLAHGETANLYVVALPEEQEPEEQEPEEVFSACVYLNDRTEDKKFANISYSYRVETEGVTLSSLLSANNINLGSKYALFTRVYDSEAKAYKFVKVDDLNSVIENHTSREYYIGAAEGITYLPYYDQGWYGSADYTEIDVEVTLSDKTLANEANNLSESVQKEIKKNVEDKTASVHVYADPILPSADEKKEIEAAAKKRGIKAENIIGYFDVYAYAFVYNNSGYGHSHTLAELGDEVEIKLRFNPNSLPEVEKGKTRQYIVIRTHDGKIDFLKVELSKNGEVAKFKSDKFSTYALAYMDIDATVVTPNDDNKNVLAGVHVGDLGGFVNDDNSAKAASASIVTVLASAVTALGAAIAKLFKKSER